MKSEPTSMLGEISEDEVRHIYLEEYENCVENRIEHAYGTFFKAVESVQ